MLRIHLRLLYCLINLPLESRDAQLALSRWAIRLIFSGVGINFSHPFMLDIEGMK